MKKFILKVLLFFACVVVMDIAFGQFFAYLRVHAKGGSTANCEYIANQCHDDIIILGSSRATHHYVPQIIEDSLGVTCYNCGEEGNGVVLAYGRLKMLANRYKPKLVIYELTPGYDYVSNESNNKYLGYLRAYYKRDGIKEIFDDFDDNLSWLKMQSNMYQNTSRILPYIIDNIISRDNNKGYEPLFGKIDKYYSVISQGKTPLISIDNMKLSYLQKLIELCKDKNIALVFIISPRLDYEDHFLEYEPALSLCKTYKVPLLNNICIPNIVNDSELFQDLNHLNDKGAILYTQIIIKELREYMTAD